LRHIALIYTLQSGSGVVNSSEKPIGEGTLQRVAACEDAIRLQYLESSSIPWIIGYSGGKDSTLLTQFVFEMLMNLPPSDRRRPVHVLCNDTLVESPILAAYIDRMLIQLGDAAESLELPVKVVKTTPNPDQTFWVNLIGRGYPAPTRMFRWCTDRMKIEPTSTYIRSTIANNGEVILLLGVRKAESANRAMTISKRKNIEGTRLNPHDDLKGCLVFRPISELTTDDVWLTLLQRNPPWGGSHRELVTLYKNAQGGECPLVVDKATAPSCGTSSSRFGCWTCTVVEKDRSMEAMIDAGNEHLEPLMDFRDWLSGFRNDRKNRMLERRNGQLRFMGDGVTPVPGPFTLEARKTILDRLLTIQAETGLTLISEDEVRRIREMWTADTILEAQKHLQLQEQVRRRAK
jgi:DNA sulfur modification protein DndC